MPHMTDPSLQQLPMLSPKRPPKMASGGVHVSPAVVSHDVPHMPQLALLSVTHIAVAPEPQQTSPNDGSPPKPPLVPGVHARPDVPQTQRPALQADVEPAGQPRPQLPQFIVSVAVLTHEPPQQL